MTKFIKQQDLSIRYSISDDGVLSTLVLNLKEIEDGDLYAWLHNSENYTCLAKVIKREVVIKE